MRPDCTKLDFSLSRLDAYRPMTGARGASCGATHEPAGLRGVLPRRTSQPTRSAPNSRASPVVPGLSAIPVHADARPKAHYGRSCRKPHAIGPRKRTEPGTSMGRLFDAVRPAPEFHSSVH